MIRTTVCVLALLGLGATAAWAQDPKVEISGSIGYSFSDGAPINPVIVNGTTYNEVAAKSGFVYDLTFGFLIDHNNEVEFLYAQQSSVLEGKNDPIKTEFTDMAVRNYHGNYVFNFGESDAKVRPYVSFGLGATQFSPADVQGRQVNGLTKFSATIGGGAKAYLSPHVGAKVGIRWTPNYINSSNDGIWCDPFWGGCWVIADPNYINQFEFTGGATFRF